MIKLSPCVALKNNFAVLLSYAGQSYPHQILKKSGAASRSQDIPQRYSNVGEDWYPTMKIFRQPKPDDWQSVIEDICFELKKKLNEHIKGFRS